MQDPRVQFSIARVLISAAALVIILLPLSREMNATHLLNPYWPAHARFHEAWLLGLMTLNGLLMLYLVWGAKQQQVFCSQLASLIGLTIIVAYGIACITSPYYGGSLTYEGQTNPMLMGVMKTLWVFIATTGCLLIGLILASALSRWQSLPAGMGEESPST